MNSFPDDMIHKAMQSRTQLDHDSTLEGQLQQSLSFAAHEQRQETAESHAKRIDSIADCLFESGLITDEIIAEESMTAIEGLYPVACTMLRSKKVRVCGRHQFLSAVLLVLREIERSYRDVQIHQFTAKTKNHTVELIEQSLNRISPYLK